MNHHRPRGHRDGWRARARRDSEWPEATGTDSEIESARYIAFLQISMNPVRLSVNVTSVTPLPIMTLTLPPARFGVPTS